VNADVEMRRLTQPLDMAFKIFASGQDACRRNDSLAVRLEYAPTHPIKIAIIVGIHDQMDRIAVEPPDRF
jgi:hypothetical protein